MKTIGFIGAGNMGGAIIKGIIDKLTDTQIFVYEPVESKAGELRKLGVTICKCEAEVVDNAQYVFLAVKPQTLPEVLPKIADSITIDTVLVSICAGISGGYIEANLGRRAKIVLSMPNTPLLIGYGATALSKLDGITDEEFSFVKSIFECSGVTAEIPSDKMNEVIAVNASSPAYIYLFAKAFLDYAERSGIEPGAAKALFSQALIGSAKMITDSGYTPDELIKMVSSPGGTTIAGLSALYDGHFTETVEKACEACTARAYELGQ
jgi:pyrroline-5-carboxylate reductase